jgi:hypothetical protein
MSLGLLLKAVARIDKVLVPWGFRFDVTEHGYSSPGGFARGRYCRGPTRIRLIYRANQGFGGVIYEQEIITDHGLFLREQIVYTVGHPSLMLRIGHADDCCMIEKGISSAARDGGDAVGALVHDLRQYAAPMLRTECPEFQDLIFSSYSRREVLQRN